MNNTFASRTSTKILLRTATMFHTIRKLNIKPVQTSNVMRQGGLLSPLILNVNVESLQDRLSLRRVRCHIGNWRINDVVLPALCVDILAIQYNTSKLVYTFAKDRPMQWSQCNRMMC